MSGKGKAMSGSFLMPSRAGEDESMQQSHITQGFCKPVDLTSKHPLSFLYYSQGTAWPGHEADAFSPGTVFWKPGN